MKSYEQMAKDVLKRRDEYLFKKQQRKIAFKHYMPMAVSLCFAVLVGLGVWQELKKLPETPPQSESRIDTSLDSIISETSATEIQSEQISQTTITIKNTTENMINTTFTEPTELIMTSTTSSNANTIQTSVITTITTQEQAETNTEEKFPISTIVTAISQTNASTSKIVTTSVSPTEATAIVNTGTSKTTTTTTTITSTQISTVTSTTTKVSESEIVIPPTNFIESTTVSTRPPDPIEPDTTPEFMEPTEIETSLPTPEQYKTCILETQEQIFQYKLAYSEVSSDKIAGYLQQVELTSYDAYGSYDNYYANAYEILNISPQDAIAVKFDDEEYFIYININLTSEQQDLLLARLLR
ncbi:MAG: hypothetical protein K2O52_06405 [Oscillospiraceae bacterium]|nr:hypothetical protein [Oscillospiraceae bacterium]